MQNPLKMSLLRHQPLPRQGIWHSPKGKFYREPGVRQGPKTPSTCRCGWKADHLYVGTGREDNTWCPHVFLGPAMGSPTTFRHWVVTLPGGWKEVGFLRGRMAQCGEFASAWLLCLFHRLLACVADHQFTPRSGSLYRVPGPRMGATGNCPSPM